jgi:hypothetical protein
VSGVVKHKGFEGAHTNTRAMFSLCRKAEPRNPSPQQSLGEYTSTGFVLADTLNIFSLSEPSPQNELTPKVLMPGKRLILGCQFLFDFFIVCLIVAHLTINNCRPQSQMKSHKWVALVLQVFVLFRSFSLS